MSRRKWRRPRLRLIIPIAVRVQNMGAGKIGKAEMLLELSEDCDAILVTEASDQDVAIAAFCRRSGWREYGDNGSGGAAAVRWLIHPRLRVLDHYTVEGHPAAQVRPGAGPEHAKRKVVQHVWVEDENRQKVRLVGTHMIATVHNRETHFRVHMKNLIGSIKWFWLRVIIAGDFNVEDDNMLLAPLYAAGFKEMVEGDTMRKREIDLIFVRGLILVLRLLTRKLRSDHRSPGVVLR